MHNKLNFRKSFTLVELLVVMIIIAMLATMGTFSYSNIMQRARNEQRKSDLKKIESALMSYYAKYGSYPNTRSPALPNCNGSWCGICDGYSTPDGINTDSGSTGYIPNLAPEFIPKLPHDPRENKTTPRCLDAGSNCYLYSSDGVDFKVLAHCTPEGELDPEDPYYDPKVGATYIRGEYAWQVSSSPQVALNW